MDGIYGLLGMLLGDAGEDTSATLLSLSTSVENCSAMRQSGCLPLLIQLIHTPEQSPKVRTGASRALYNIVRATQHQDEDNQELQILELIQQLREYSRALRNDEEVGEESSSLRHPIPAMSFLFKLSFIEIHRNTISLLGGLHAIAEVIEVDHSVHGSPSDDPNCLALRRYAGMILTVLTSNDSKNNSFLCSCSGFIKAWVEQLKSSNEDLHHVTASVFRNLSWRADSNSKRVLREMGSVTHLTRVAMQTRRESTLKSVLSALWNLSAHCASNKVDICAVDGALEFLVDMLLFKGPSKRLAIIENASGIIRNVSSHVAIEEKYREMLRNKNGLHILVKLLTSPSLIIVNNACGTLWNLSARCIKDQKTLWALGAVPILQNLVQSNHQMISTGASHALKNLLTAKEHNAFELTIPISGDPGIKKDEGEQQSCAPVKAEEEDIKDSRSEGFSRPPSSPLGDQHVHIQTNNSLDESRTSDRNDEGDKLDYEKSPFEKRKGSPVGSSYFERDCQSNDAIYETEGDSPVDYSKKYLENDPATKQRSDIKVKSETREKEFSERNENLFGDYAETDLDQPTDYSLRYAEDDTDDEEKEEREYFNAGTEQEDTVKTYCTEGTPYETPFNFSTATSMSDLRLEDTKEGESSKKVVKNIQGTIEEFNECGNPVEQEEVSENMNDLDKSEDRVILEANNAQSPEVNYYYNERSSGGVSRANSLNSLESGVAAKGLSSSEKPEGASATNKEEKFVEIKEEPKQEEVPEKIIDKESKVVTFGGEDHYAEETPLMFSRCSSLGSLSGFEQHSIHDDRSSIISDFSRLTSGAVSPSELPDSPTQTVPPSPRCNTNPKNVEPFHSRTSEERPLRLPFPKCPYQKKNSVFEDDTAAFKEESTPIEFSAATSLSSLTIDDEPRVPEALKRLGFPGEGTESGKGNFKAPQVVVSDKDHEVSDCDGEDDEDILAACISMGMQNNRYRENFKKEPPKTYPTSVTNLIRYQTSSTLDRLDSAVCQGRETSMKPKLAHDVPVITPDTVHIYCTEDTPADISPVGSQSNLSALSMPSIMEDFEKPERESLNDLSDNSSNSGDDEKILDECIQSGMSKPISPSLARSTQCEGFLSSTLNESRQPRPRMIIGQDPESNNSSDDSPNQSDDDAILAECIESAMPKAKLNLLSKPSTSRQSEKIKKSFENPRKGEPKSPESEGSSSLSEEEEEMILAQCIRSGMPKVHN
uniref:Apc_4 protein n=1 Tax=Fopius arisanus TaxID=64838 RepID=A0A0C9QMT5_9HYME